MPERTPKTLFISDLHLTPAAPRPVFLFARFMREFAPRAEALYILGDFFDSWVGDDALEDAFCADIAGMLRQLAQQGVALYFMPGNRDFLAGERLARATGWSRLPDPARIDIYGRQTLISHGDQYCTDDVEYQRFRAMVRDAGWQSAFLAKPLDERRRIAQDIRARSDQEKSAKGMEITDVCVTAIQAAFVQAGAHFMIHGHTHRPAMHHHTIDGQAHERWVLPDWGARGGYLECTPERWALRWMPESCTPTDDAVAPAR